MLKSKSVVAVSLLSLAILIVAGFGCRPGQVAATPAQSDSLFESPTIVADGHGFDLANLDKSVSACSNFFQDANGGWVARNQIPAAYD
jgi:putative endopeptidase